MTLHTDLIYRSQNGDAWHLLREAPSARILVRHTANATSGGWVTDLSVKEFLSINGAGPEHGALRALLTKLAQPGYPTMWIAAATMRMTVEEVTAIAAKESEAIAEMIKCITDLKESLEAERSVMEAASARLLSGCCRAGLL